MDKNISAAYIAVRVVALLIFTLGLWMLISNVIESVGDFNPTYFIYYFKIQLLRPLVAIVLAVLLWLMSPKLARLVCGGLKNN